MSFTKQPDQSDEYKLYQEQPEIKHMFRADAKRAPETIAWAFTFALAAPLALFILSALALGGSKMPGGSTFLLSMIFVGIIAAMIGVIGLYFFYISIFDAMKYLSILGVAAILVGKQALRGYVKSKQD